MGIERFQNIFAEIVEYEALDRGQFITTGLARLRASTDPRFAKAFALSPEVAWAREMETMHKSLIDGGKRHSTALRALAKRFNAMTKADPPFVAQARPAAAAR